jgi:hypothetical protein
MAVTRPSLLRFTIAPSRIANGCEALGTPPRQLLRWPIVQLTRYLALVTFCDLLTHGGKDGPRQIGVCCDSVHIGRGRLRFCVPRSGDCVSSRGTSSLGAVSGPQRTKRAVWSGHVSRLPFNHEQTTLTEWNFRSFCRLTSTRQKNRAGTSARRRQFRCYLRAKKSINDPLRRTGDIASIRHSCA